jgi:hypothetical protein
MEIPDSFQQKYAFRFTASLTYFPCNVFVGCSSTTAKRLVRYFSGGAAPAAALKF